MTTIRHSSIQQDAETDALKKRITELEAERDMATKEIAKWAREAGLSLAREEKLREYAECALLIQYNGHPMYALTVPEYHRLIATPADDTALKEAIRQGKKEALLAIADEENPITANDLRRMAEKL